MPEAACTTAKKRGPKTPAGKARSAMNARKHGLRARAFGLLPEDDPAEWTRHVQDLEAGYGPVDAVETKLVDAIAVAMWRELRADRFEAEVLTDIAPRCAGRSHGSDLQVPDHAAALATALRCQGSAAMATRRAMRAFLEHRKARQAGLLLPARTREPEPQECTNDLPAVLGRTLPAAPPPAVAPTPAEPDPDAWLAEVPVVEADPSDEALRRAQLGMVAHEGLRAQAATGTLQQIEQLVVAGDPAAYEEWFAGQPKPDFPPMPGLPDSIRADIEQVTKHNPPWLRGEYLSYYRPPVPAPLFAAAAANDPEPVGAATASVAPADTIPALRARIARLLDRSAPRLARELDLAEAICAVRWPKWPEYRGPVDLALLRRALAGIAIDARTLHWLGGREIVAECRGGDQAGSRAVDGDGAGPSAAARLSGGRPAGTGRIPRPPHGSRRRGRARPGPRPVSPAPGPGPRPVQWRRQRPRSRRSRA